MVSRQKWSEVFPLFLSAIQYMPLKKKRKLKNKTKPKQTKKHHKFSIEENLAYELK